MKILIDMNLSPSWVQKFEEEGIESVHWSSIGDIRATDRTIMTYAAENGYIVFTHDLDFGALLAATQAESPSVIQVRIQDPLPEAIGSLCAQSMCTRIGSGCISHCRCGAIQSSRFAPG
jgi:predicted nuclease of predicted toxin-antitoxin system